MRAQAKIEGVRAEATSTGWRLTTREGAVHEVPAVTAAVWHAADGHTEAAGLLAAARAVEPAADMALVWSALDALGDAGLLVSRAAPPAGGLDRRAAIRTMALAAGAVLAVLPRGARSAEEAAAKKKVQPLREETEKRQMKASEEDEKSLRQDEEKMKGEIKAIEARAQEEESKLAPAARADVAAGRQRESAAKKQITELRAREEEKKRSVKAVEQNKKAE